MQVAILQAMCFDFKFKLNTFYILTQVEVAKSGLQASLLVRHPETKELFVNFDPQIITLIRESECMVRLGLDIPFGAQTLMQKRETVKKNYNRLEVRLDQIDLSLYLASRLLRLIVYRYHPNYLV